MAGQYSGRINVIRDMTATKPNLIIRLAQDERDLRAAQRLRYEVFIEELGGDGAMVDHVNRLEIDEFDPWFDHLLLIDPSRDAAQLQDVVGVYRLLTSDKAEQLGRYYSESEYDLTPLKATGRKLLELGRSCVHKDHRGGAAMLLLWNALADYVLERDIEVMFGTASFHGTNPETMRQALSYLHYNHLAPQDIRVTALEDHRQKMDLLSEAEVDRREALASMPPLIKAYLRLGGFVGDGAWIDHDFNTTDVCLLMDTGRMSGKHRDFYTRKSGSGQ